MPNKAIHPSKTNAFPVMPAVAQPLPRTICPAWRALRMRINAQTPRISPTTCEKMGINGASPHTVEATATLSVCPAVGDVTSSDGGPGIGRCPTSCGKAGLGRAVATGNGGGATKGFCGISNMANRVNKRRTRSLRFAKPAIDPYRTNGAI